MGERTEANYTPTVKICGIRNSATLNAMRQLDVDQVGFVFAPSKRQVTIEEAASMLRTIRNPAFGAKGAFDAVGVFVNPAMEELEEVMQAAPLDIIQLHGNESPEFCHRVRAAFGTRIFKAIPIPEQTASTPLAILEQFERYAEAADALLVDTYDPVTSGGSGRTFSWDLLPPLLEWTRKQNIPLIVAGGLNPDNVARLVTQYAPDGVDVSSGVETNGMKDIVKITKFVERVKRR